MNCKKILITTALISLMYSIPSISFSDTIQDGNMGGNFYISGKYVPSVSHFGSFSAKEESKSTVGVFGLKHDWDGSPILKNKHADFTVPNYSFRYENNPFLGFAGAIGYSMGGPRIEFEISYEAFDVKSPNINYQNDAHRYCALSHHTSAAMEADKFVFLKNEGLIDISLAINACYDIINDKVPVSPYICAGIGTDLISMFEATSPKISYQGKLGISYSINPETSVFIGGHFHRIIGNEFRDIPAIVPSNSTTISGPQFATVTLNVCHFGLELGGRFNF
ncbi:P44/Msp2 family outer membrane protein [Ehrlichia canis]|uniref:Surface antigen msp4 n=9 Tax=Ehrlichia canis TaxID=944 RepID=A0ACA6AX03_EHRCJ